MIPQSTLPRGEQAQNANLSFYAELKDSAQ